MVGGPPKNVLNVNRSGYCLLNFTTYSALWVKKFKLAKADGPENNETIISYSSATVSSFYLRGGGSLLRVTLVVALAVFASNFS